MERAVFRGDRRPFMFAWRSSDDEKLRHIGSSARSLGPENLKTLQNVVFTKRPDLLTEDSKLLTGNKSSIMETNRQPDTVLPQ
ncbi:hypothetical protein SD208_00850 [Ochrobactrum sp. BD67]